MAKRLRVYLSSTYEDLKAYREAVFAGLAKAGLDVARMEDYTAADERPVDLCLRDVAQSDIYVGLYAWRYGYIPPSEHGNPEGRSITDLEYRKAEECKLRKLLFFAHPATCDGWPDHFKDEVTGAGECGAKLIAFRKECGTEKTASFFRTPDELATLVLAAIMRSGLTERPYRSQSPPLGDRYVERELLLKRLKERLLPSSDEGQSRMTLAVLYGAPGVGKTVAASAFAHDEEVMRAFPDGILWISLGENPNFRRHLSDPRLTEQAYSDLEEAVLKRYLTNLALALPDPQFMERAYSDIEPAVGRLRSLMRDRAYLLVVDDAWVPEHVKPEYVKKAFLIGGPRCLLLVTARNAQIASVIGAEKVELAPMAEEEAIKLMARWAGPISQTDEPIARQLAQEVGYLPLALELIGARVGASESWSAYMERWRQQRLGALTRDRKSRGKEDSVRDSLELSLKLLPDDDRERYVRLGVFPRKALFPASAVATLWECDLFEANDLLIDLAGQAVLFQRKPEAGFRYEFHDLLYDFVLERIGRTGLLQAHETLLEGYWRLGHPGWPSVPDDGYFFDYLSYHLIQAGRGDELIELLTGARDWMNTKAATLGSDSSLALDVERALSLEPDAIKLVKLHAVKQVIRERLGWVSDTDLRTLVWRNRDAQALNQARLRLSPDGKFGSLIAVYEELRARGESRPELLDEAEAVARVIGEGAARADALRVLGTQRLSVADARWSATFDEAREAANVAEQGATQWKALLGIAEALLNTDNVKCGETLDDARAVAEQLTDGSYRSAALRDVALAYARAGRADDALLTLKSHTSQRLGDAIQEVLLASHRAGTPPRMLSGQALAVIEHVGTLSKQTYESYHREGHADTETLGISACIHALNGEREAYDAVMSTWSEDDKSWYGAKAVRGLVSALAEAGDFEGAARELRTIHFTGDFASALDDIVSVANRRGYVEIDRLVSEAAPLILSKTNLESYDNKFWPIILTGRLSIQVGKPQTALELIPSLTDEGKVLVLNELLPELDRIEVAGRATLLQQVRQQIKFSDEYWHERALRAVALALAKVRDDSADSVLKRAWSAANSRATKSQPEGVLLDVAKTFATYGDVESCRRVLGIVRNVMARVTTLCELAGSLFDNGDERYAEVLAEALETAQAIELDDERARALVPLVGLLGHTNDLRWRSIAEETEKLAHSLSDPDLSRYQVLLEASPQHRRASERLANLADCLAELKHFDESLRVAENIPDPNVRGRRLAHIAMELGKIGDPRSDTIFDEERYFLFAKANDIRTGGAYYGDFEENGRVLMHALAGAGRFDEAVEVARLRFREDHRSNMLAGFTQTLIQAERLDDAWEIGHSITLPSQRAEALVNLALALALRQDARGQGLLDEVREVARTTERPDDRANVFRHLARGIAWTGDLADAERTAETIPLHDFRADAFREIANAVRETDPERANKLLRRALTEARAIPDIRGRQGLMTTLADTLARTQGIHRTLGMLETRSFDEFIGTLVRWAPLFEELNPEFPPSVLREVIALAAWIRPDWQEVRDCL